MLVACITDVVVGDAHGGGGTTAAPAKIAEAASGGGLAPIHSWDTLPVYLLQ